MMDEFFDFHPKTWLGQYRKNSIFYLFKMGLFYLGICVLLEQIANFVLVYYVPGYQIPSVPVSLTMGLTSAPLEEITFFGVPYFITGNPLVILTGGIIWSSLHIFNTFSFSVLGLAYGTVLFTIPHVFFSLRTWLSKKGWFAVLFHGAWNGIVLGFRCSTGSTCVPIGSGWYLALDLLSVIAIIGLSVLLYKANRYKRYGLT